MVCIDPGATWHLASSLSNIVGDCNDTNDTIYSGAVEICDGVDNDCDGQVDEFVTNTFYQDSDGDTHGNAAVTTGGAGICMPPTGFVTGTGDCNDAENTIYVGAPELT